MVNYKLCMLVYMCVCACVHMHLKNKRKWLHLRKPARLINDGNNPAPLWGAVTAILCINDGAISLINTYLCGESAEITLCLFTWPSLASKASPTHASSKLRSQNVKWFWVGMQKTEIQNTQLELPREILENSLKTCRIRQTPYWERRKAKGEEGSREWDC